MPTNGGTAGPASLRAHGMSRPDLRLQRTTLLVADLERSLRLYRDVLGFEVAFSKESAADSYSYDVFTIPRGSPIRFCVLGLPEQPGCLGLTEVEGLEPAAERPRRSGLVIHVPDLDAALSGADALGLHRYAEDRLLTHDGREGREVGVVDADGNLVVLYHIGRAAP